MREHSGHPYIHQREGEREREWPPPLFISRPPRLLQPVCFTLSSSLPPSCSSPPPPVAVPGIASQVLSSKLTDCGESWRVEEDMRGGEGVERGGGPEFPWRPHRTPVCGTNKCVCVCVCDGSRLAVGRHRHIFFIKVRISHDVTHIHTTRTYTNAHCCETYCHITPSYSISQPNKVCVKGRNYNMA